MSSLLRLPTLMLALLSISCSNSAPNTTPAPDTGDQPQARIENRASLDMDIFAIRGDGERIRLGFLPGGETSVFVLPATVTAGATSIRFEARPVRRGGDPVVSEPFGVREEISWSISPQ